MPLRKNVQVPTVAVTEENEEDSSTTEDEEVNEAETQARGMKYMTPLHVYDHLKALWKNERETLDLIFSSAKAGGRGKNKSGNDQGNDHRIFFTEVIAVPPCRFRPPSVFGDSSFDHPQNTYLAEILKLSQRIVELRVSTDTSDKKDDTTVRANSDDTFARLVQTWTNLQLQANYFYDSSSNTTGGGKQPPAGIKQILEKKEGLFRKHMMGKRVNFAARTVISPDVNLETREIGVPMVFAKKLTYPEPVTAFNVRQLRQAVINGPNQHPGATHVQMEDGTLASLEHLSPEGRMALANQLLTGTDGMGGKKVLRHIQNGDVVLMNRQPTLHKPSIMAHRARILPGEKTIRMHYANCNTYNADFDGDEMNMHFPQSELGRAEAYEIASTEKQYLVPTDGSPLRGLIQDHIVTGVLLTLKDTFLTRERYQQLLFAALPDSLQRINLLPPTIQKPQALWTGKQLVSTLLLNISRGLKPINLTAKGKVGVRLWKGHEEEAVVIIVDGWMLTGVLDKAQIGDASYGLVHAVYELYGPEASGDLLTALSRMLTRYLQHIGFTCRMDDILVTDEANARRRALIDGAKSTGRQVVAEYADVSADDRCALNQAVERICRSEELSRGLDGAFKGKLNTLTSNIIEACLPDGQLRPFPHNNMALMTSSGAKGSMVNFSQISGCLGQQELEGRRVPVMVSGKTLPAFVSWDTRPRAGGYITQRFLSGIRPQEFFFHCMAGREGLIDTAVKTSRSGYLQRCLIKHLESLKVHYDHTVRDADGTLLQFYYGEDGIDVTRQAYLHDRFDFCASNFEALLADVKPAQSMNLIETGQEALDASRKAWKKPNKYEPAMAKYSPSVHLGITSDKFYASLELYIKEHPEISNVKQFRALMWLKFQRALADPGEAVGLLAAQSIGEPSTQMTLNTFHLAGFGAKNVTLGIPRLREIIMTAAKKLKTPSMTVPVLTDVKEDPANIATRLSKLSLKELVKDVVVSEQLVITSSISKAAVNAGKRSRVYGIEIDLVDLMAAARHYGVTADEIAQAIEGSFAQKLILLIDKTIKRLKGSSTASLVDSQAAKKFEEKSASLDDDMDAKEESRRRANKDQDESDDEEEKTKDEVVEDDEDVKESKAMSLSSSSEDEDEEEENQMDVDVDPSMAIDTKRQSYLKETRNIRNYVFDTTRSKITMDIIFPAGTPKLLMLDMIERIIPDVTVRQISGISRLFAIPAKPGNCATITTEGVNIHAIWEYAHLFDLNKLQSNDIYAILCAYGVEAARATIVREVAAVFEVYGISIDPRHLYLIADYMTVDGGYKPFNRAGMESASSPFLKMTFETTVNFLRQAALFGEADSLQSPAARLVMGQPVNLGTGSFQLCHPLN